MSERVVIAIGAALTVLAFCLSLYLKPAHARDPDGRYATAPLHDWFNKLASGKGLCCSFADGVAIEDPDIDVKGGHYRVRLNGEWFDVPDDAVITEPNLIGRAFVWPYQGGIRCFLPGAGT